MDNIIPFDKPIDCKKEFTHDEMIERLGQLLGQRFDQTWFADYYACFCADGDCEDPEIASEILDVYPNLCAGRFDETEWRKFVSDTFWDLYDVRFFPRN